MESVPLLFGAEFFALLKKSIAYGVCVPIFLAMFFLIKELMLFNILKYGLVDGVCVPIFNGVQKDINCSLIY